METFNGAKHPDRDHFLYDFNKNNLVRGKTMNIKDLKLGWNLGNTLDAYGEEDLGLGYETAWQDALTTPEMIKKVKEGGFDHIRIPVSWRNHVSGPDHIIDVAWANRVQEIVDMSLEAGLLVILNTHHEINKDYVYPTKALYEQSAKYIRDVWSQIAERYKDYDDRLMLEGLNEPRLVGHPDEWNLVVNDDCNEAVEMINRLNQVFVDTVRETGGYNETRYLLVGGYATSPEGVFSDLYRLPQDTIDESRIMVVIHAYRPYRFALQIPGVNTWDESKEQEDHDLESFMKEAYDKYVSQGIPVIIDEFGALLKDGENHLQCRVKWAITYIKMARKYELPVTWWDNFNVSGHGEQFTLLDREKLVWSYPEIVENMVENL